jgi:alpha-galactosidase
VNCDRPGHGHGPNDGSFAHVTALYGVLDTLRQRYPSLLIENCSGGGNRLDFAMMRYTDVGWMADQTAPSVRTRHNLEGLSLIFPPSYLLSFVTELGWEPLHHSPDLAKYVRSRMGGVLGLSFRSAWLGDDDLAAIGAQIALAKRLRPILTSATATLLTAQANSDETQWDVLQEAGPDGSVVLFAFENVGATGSMTVVPSSLRPDLIYLVVSADSGPLGQSTGADLMAGGILLQTSQTSAAHILSLVPQP